MAPPAFLGVTGGGAKVCAAGPKSEPVILVEAGTHAFFAFIWTLLPASCLRSKDGGMFAVCHYRALHCSPVISQPSGPRARVIRLMPLSLYPPLSL